jgi:hypothetical protein
MLTEKEIKAQSWAAFRTWETKWRENAKINKTLWEAQGKPSHRDLVLEGKGKSLLCVGMGESFESQLEIIKKYKFNVDIACVDKAFKPLMENGIVPKWVFLADAGIDIKWLGDVDTNQSTLIANMAANPEWAQNWKGKVYYYINKDNINSEEMFKEITGYDEVIPASSNVGNTVVVASTQWFGYDNYYLVGYDYCWANCNYYALHDSDKRYYLKDIEGIDTYGNLVTTSNNLYFSARWLNDFYLTMSRTKGWTSRVYNCSGRGFLEIPQRELETVLRTSKKKKLSKMEALKVREGKSQIITFKNKEDFLNQCENYEIFEIKLRGVRK